MEYSDNYYVRTKSYEIDSNKLTESLQCDVCIIGGGLSGISTFIKAATSGTDALMARRRLQ